jgi:hypothetical protein
MTDKRARELEVLKTLPRPPKQMHQCTDEQVRDWLKACADVSAEGVRTAFAAHLWPGTLGQRLSCWGFYHELEKSAQNRELAEQAKAADERREKLRASEEKQLKRLGWA